MMGTAPEYQNTGAPFPFPSVDFTVRPSSVEIALSRMVNALEKLADQQPQGEDIVEWLSTLDHNELDDAVMRRQNLGTPVMWNVLEVLKEWASGRA